MKPGMMNRNELIVIIDPQKDFTDKQGAYAARHPGTRQISLAKKNISSIIRQYNKNLVIVYSSYLKGQFEEGLSLCIPGTPGHEIDLNINGECKLIGKNDHSCFSSGAFKNYLKMNQVNSLVLCGFLAEYCVMKTAIDGLQSGYRISLLRDYIGTGDDVQQRKEDMLLKLEKMGAIII